jgi:hypothetical protein
MGTIFKNIFSQHVFIFPTQTLIRLAILERVFLRPEQGDENKCLGQHRIQVYNATINAVNVRNEIKVAYKLAPPHEVGQYAAKSPR